MRLEKQNVRLQIFLFCYSFAIFATGCNQNRRQQQRVPQDSIASQIVVREGESLAELYARLPEVPKKEGIARYGGGSGAYFEAFQFSDDSILQISLNANNRVLGKLFDDERNWPTGFDVIRESR